MIDPTANRELVSHVLELLEDFGPVHARRMFGGHGLLLDGIMFALVARGVLYFKTGSETLPAYTLRGLQPFSYRARGRSVTLSYHEAPTETLDNAEEMTAWAREAYRSAHGARATVRGPA